jgi:DNA polymerase-1
MESKRSLLLLIDGNALIHRAFHALPPLTLPKTGEPVGAVYGFSMMLVKAINELKPTHYAIAFDRKAPTFRSQLFDQYKAQRPAAPMNWSVSSAGWGRWSIPFAFLFLNSMAMRRMMSWALSSTQADAQGMETVILTGTRI